MTPIRIVFASNESLLIYSACPESFTASVSKVAPPDIKSLEYADVPGDTVPELTDVELTLKSGAVMLCQIPNDELAKAKFIIEVEDYSVTTALVYAALGKTETELDARFEAAALILNNLPDLDYRLELHKAYMKRKQAYVSAIEALVDGAIRRPNE